jgi:hypothetical protein
MDVLAPGNEFYSHYNLATDSAGASELLIVHLNDQHPRIGRRSAARTHRPHAHSTTLLIWPDSCPFPVLTSAEHARACT